MSSGWFIRDGTIPFFNILGKEPFVKFVVVLSVLVVSFNPTLSNLLRLNLRYQTYPSSGVFILKGDSELSSKHVNLYLSLDYYLQRFSRGSVDREGKRKQKYYPVGLRSTVRDGPYQ